MRNSPQKLREPAENSHQLASRALLHATSVVDFHDASEAILAALLLGTDQPCSTLLDFGRPREAIRFSTRYFTSASTCWFPNSRAASL